MNRRHFVASCLTGLATVALPRLGRAQTTRPELRISRILVQPMSGRRLTPVAPNAYAAYRGYERVEPLLRIQTTHGVEGIGLWRHPPDGLQALLGLDPFKLFSWTGDGRIEGWAAEYADAMQKLGGADVALLDLIGKVTTQPIAALLGPSVREEVPIYNSTVYMEDLLTPEQIVGLAYLDGSDVKDPAERVARKAKWVMGLPEGFRAIKIKLGRSKWMRSPAEADARDIAVTHAVRSAIGPEAQLLVDGNRDYGTRPGAVIAYAEAVRDANVYFLEEMIPDADVEELRKLRLALRAAGNPVKLASGESSVGGMPESLYTQRIPGPHGSEPLIDIEQADMNQNGFLFIRSKAAKQRPLGMKFAPHNFGSKIGFYAQVHLGLTVPNWETSEIDDVLYPALHPEGFEIRRGAVRLTGAPGLGVHVDATKLDAPTADLRT